MPFSPAQLEQLRDIFRAELAAPPLTDRILSVPEAIVFSKHGSPSAFYRWCRRWRLTSVSNGRFSRAQLDSALEREAQKRRRGRFGQKPRATQRAA